MSLVERCLVVVQGSYKSSQSITNQPLAPLTIKKMFPTVFCVSLLIERSPKVLSRLNKLTQTSTMLGRPCHRAQHDSGCNKEEGEKSVNEMWLWLCVCKLPGFLAVQVTLHPDFVELRSVVKCSLTILLLLTTSLGKVVPHIFSIKVVPSPSSITRWS